MVTGRTAFNWDSNSGNTFFEYLKEGYLHWIKLRHERSENGLRLIVNIDVSAVDRARIFKDVSIISQLHSFHLESDRSELNCTNLVKALRIKTCVTCCQL